MEIVFLGTTAAVPSAERGHSAIALKYYDEVILWDCGEATQRQLIKSKTSYMRIDNIFITHFHGDHFLGLPGLIQTMSFAGREEMLHIFGPRGINVVMKKILSLGEYDLDYEIKTHVISHGFKVETEKYRIKCIKVKHNVETYGLIFEEIKGREFVVEKARKLGLEPGPAYSKLQRGEKVRVDGRWISPEDVLGKKKKGIKIVYSSDTRPCADVLRECVNAVLIHDATFDEALAENAEETMHSTCIEAADVAREGKAKKLLLTHISPRYKDGKLLLKQAKKRFKNVEIMSDLEEITV